MNTFDVTSGHVNNQTVRKFYEMCVLSLANPGNQSQACFFLDALYLFVNFPRLKAAKLLFPNTSYKLS